jgi:hypothetical protein
VLFRSGLIHGVAITSTGAQALAGWWVAPSFAAAYLATALVLLALKFLPQPSASSSS